MNKVNNLPVDLIEDDLWDHYSGLPSPMWYQYVEERDEEENTSISNDTEVVIRQNKTKKKKHLGLIKKII